MTSRYVPDRGDAVWLEFDPQAGHRPAVVLSPAAYNAKVGLAIVCPITSQVKGYPFEVPLPPTRKLSGVVLADQVKSLDWRAGNARLVLRLPEGITQQVMLKLHALLA